MAQTLETLNKEWAAIVPSAAARRALMRWSAAHPVLLPAIDLDAVIELGYCADVGAEVRRALATMAPTDQLAARTLLQELLGGLVNLARRIGRDADAVDDVVAIAWERIRTYPTCRPGSVSGNVLLDVRKRYSRQHESSMSPPVVEIEAMATPGASPEDQVVSATVLGDLLIAGEQRGLSREVLATIVRSRIHGESMTDLALEQQVSLKVLWHRRWRAEARLRDCALSA
jgi:DNA-directed RNA polymerase specialized sigma24 family protein